MVMIIMRLNKARPLPRASNLILNILKGLILVLFVVIAGSLAGELQFIREVVAHICRTG